ncbi:zinc ABC transporter substrate-binding protein [Hoeflea alexandrii]|uniref:High-affinity zinc uptake system protein ZnuA n=1 Tax=Hoeflea alexandrii TaxID=288436 RepID=A0ABT1CVM3_9HYPH|nr:zinc ABC transporter substrate-binding protein [Hoeflea alexandrii]MCO6410218.1 zinc ABC transporter solute-binding protein [Hoeflea alexandrii]MCY0153179.1 zinc ABC transporter substrate-binding protein [Hoeflea alexandrii]
MNRLKGLLLASTLIASSSVSASAEVKVVASIKPIHSLVAAVMEGVGEPGLIIEGAGSPHTYALKPSQAQMLEQANVVFWIGHELEAFLEKPLETVGADAKSIELIDAHDLLKLGFREGGAFEKHDHADEAGHDDHAHEAEATHDHDHEKTADAAHDHDHDKTAEAAHDHDHDNTAEAAHDHDHDHDHEKTAEAGHEGHDHGAFDAHVWLDPVNAKAMVHEIEEALVEADPANAAKYEANAEAVTAKLDTLIADVSSELEPVKGKGFIVFHDGYQYFENRFGVTASGSITVSPEVMPGAERITEIRARVQELGAACVFAEPQFEPKLVSTVTEGTNAKSGTLDPLGAELEDGADLYFQLIRNMSTSIKTCLTEAS